MIGHRRDDAADAFMDAAHWVGLATEGDLQTEDDRHRQQDLTLTYPAGGRLPITLKRLSLVSGDGLTGRLAKWNIEHPQADILRVVVADRITQDARKILNKAGWGWLDLRGHLHLVASGLFVDTDLPSFKIEANRSSLPAGKVGLEVATFLLMEPARPAAVRHLARRIDRAASSVSEVLHSLSEAQLIDSERRPVTPELFWAVASRWQPAGVDVASVPAPGRGAVNSTLRLGFEDVENTVGWALSDTLGAVTYGAPVATRADQPPDFYVPNAAIQRRALQSLGRAPDHSHRAATIRIAPVDAVCAARVDATSWAAQKWPLAHPLFVALDLAVDPGRGREIIEGWTPPERWHRVW
jgi:hypothetical protein